MELSHGLNVPKRVLHYAPAVWQRLILSQRLVFVHYMGAKPWMPTGSPARLRADWEPDRPAYAALEELWWRVRRGQVAARPHDVCVGDGGASGCSRGDPGGSSSGGSSSWGGEDGGARSGVDGGRRRGMHLYANLPLGPVTPHPGGSGGGAAAAGLCTAAGTTKKKKTRVEKRKAGGSGAEATSPATHPRAQELAARFVSLARGGGYSGGNGGGDSGEGGGGNGGGNGGSGCNASGNCDGGSGGGDSCCHCPGAVPKPSGALDDSPGPSLPHQSHAPHVESFNLTSDGRSWVVLARGFCPLPPESMPPRPPANRRAASEGASHGARKDDAAADAAGAGAAPTVAGAGAVWVEWPAIVEHVAAARRSTGGGGGGVGNGGGGSGDVDGAVDTIDALWALHPADRRTFLAGADRSGVRGQGGGQGGESTYEDGSSGGAAAVGTAAGGGVECLEHRWSQAFGKDYAYGGLVNRCEPLPQHPLLPALTTLASEALCPEAAPYDLALANWYLWGDSIQVRPSV